MTSLCSVQLSVGPNCKGLINFIKIDRVIKSSKNCSPDDTRYIVLDTQYPAVVTLDLDSEKCERTAAG